MDAASKYRREAFALAEAIDRIFDPNEVVRRMQGVMAGFGLEGLTLGGLPRSEGNFGDLVLVRRLPEEWPKRYFAKRYDLIDPVVGRLKRAVVPFEPCARDYELGYDPRLRDMMGCRRDLGILDGYVVPVPGRRGKGYVWMSGARPELSPLAKPSLHLLAHYVFNRVENLVARAPASKPRLSEREREVLSWIAAGKSSWEIGEILGIAKRTVDEHAGLAIRKLGAANRTQAVAIAFRDRLISI
jgi:LuxR family quorum sensing-dependent transcriptional regulator